MSELNRTVRRVEAALGCNRFLYWLGRIPLIRRLFPPKLYAAGPTKEFLLDAVRVLKWIYAFLGKPVYLLLVLFLPALAVGGLEDLAGGWGAGVWAFFWLSIVCGALLQPAFFEATALKYVCVLQMRMPAWQLVRYEAGGRYLKKWLTFLPALVLIPLLLGQPWWTGLVLEVELVGACLTAEGIHLLLWRRWGKLPSANSWYIIALAALCIAIAVIPALAELAPPDFLVHPITLIVLILGGGWGGWSLRRFDDWYSLVKAYSKPENISYSYAKGKAAGNQFKDVQLRSDDLTAETTVSQRRQGWDYLNELFFVRHRRLLARPTMIGQIITAALMAATVVFCFLFPELCREILGEALTYALPYMVFIAYLVFNTMDTRICKAMFYNCDLSLLRYSWYREPRVVLRMFTLRLRKLILLNFRLTGTLVAGLVVCALACRLSFPRFGGELAAFCASVLLLGVLFAVHPLFLYYVFQPYTSDLNVKNPFFTALSMIMYIVCYLCIQIKQPPAGFALIVMGLTVVYTAVALTLVFRRAPRTFRVK